MATNAYVGVLERYTPIEYIESSGTQYIDTEITQAGFHIAIDFETTNMSDLQIITGTYGPADANRYYLRIDANGTLNTQFGGYSGNNKITGPTLSINTRYTIDAKLFNGSQSLKVGTTTYGTQSISGQTPPTVNLILPGCVSNGSPGNLSYMKIYGAEYYDSNNTLVKRFIPVLDKSGVACFFDTVGQKAHYNKGTGMFAGGNPTGEPQIVISAKARKIKNVYVGGVKSYTPVEYIQGTGQQCFDTNYIPTTTTKVVIDYQFLSKGNKQLGCGDGTDTQRFCISVGTNYFYVALGPGGDTTIASDLLRHTFTIDAPNKRVLIDSTSIARNYSSFSTTFSFSIFARKNGEGYSWIHDAKFYSAQIYENGTLVRNFIPVADENNIACIYETIEEKFYYSTGIGVCSVGSVTGSTVTTHNVSKKLVKGYVGVGGKARKCFSISLPIVVPQGRFEIRSSAYRYSIATHTKDYILLCGGQQGNGYNPVNTVTCFNSSGVSSDITSLPEAAGFGGRFTLNGYGLYFSGFSASNWANRSLKVTAYDNSLVRTVLSDLDNSGAYEVPSESNSVHGMMVSGNYNGSSNLTAYSWDTSLARTTVSNSSTQRVGACVAPVGNYLVVSGSKSGSGNSHPNDAYDNSNVKTTLTNPYSSVLIYTKGLHTDTMCAFFGGGSQDNTSYTFNYIKAYDANLVLTSSTMPAKNFKLTGQNIDGKYMLLNWSESTSYLYDSNLVLVETIPGGTGSENSGYHADNTAYFGFSKQAYNNMARIYTYNL